MEVDGLLLTEYPPGERTFRGAFPRRNRLISGLARVLIVVEAAEASGTLLTVQAAVNNGPDWDALQATAPDAARSSARAPKCSASRVRWSGSSWTG